jgi:hypothetical protein
MQIIIQKIKINLALLVFVCLVLLLLLSSCVFLFSCFFLFSCCRLGSPVRGLWLRLQRTRDARNQIHG